MRRLEALNDEFRVLRQLLRGMPRRGSHGERLAGFYAGQAGAYDRFRERLLAGRAELIAPLALQPGAHVVELGAGTGRNVQFFPADTQARCRFTLVDLCAPLLAQARQRVAGRANVCVVEADATAWQPAQPADLVLLSYALSMMPSWRGVIANARRMLAPGGRVAVVDFYVSAATPAPGLSRHGLFTRAFWPRWFAHDGVQLGPERLDELRQQFPRHTLVEDAHPVPYLPGLRVPHFRFVGSAG
jgi:S-adenosylmethionine-diacylgycerolhomoserine-N-methlytransferase